AGTLVRELVLQVIRGEVAGVPSSQVIRLSASGTVSVEGPVEAGGRPIVRAAQLLDCLLPASSDNDQFRVPGGLKLVVARALGAIDLPPFPSLGAFADALARFSATDPAQVVTDLTVRWSESVAPRTSPATASDWPGALPAAHVEPFGAPRPIELRSPLGSTPLTVSDIRRARRATGMPLAQVADRSRIPLKLLRQLEWGYLLNWPTGHYGRTQLVRYARATGLDEQLVIATIEPLLDQADSRRALLRHRPDASVFASGPLPPGDTLAAPSLPTAIARQEVRAEPIVVIEEIPLARARPALPWPESVEPAAGEARTLSKVLAALAIPALLAIGLLPAWWAYSVVPSPDLPPAIEQPAAPGARSEPIASNPARGARPEAGAATSPDLSDTDTSKNAVDAPGSAADSQNDLAARPGYRLAADSVAYSPSFASVGTAMFYHPDSDDRSPLTRADSDSRNSVLRITRIVDDAARNFHVRPSPDGTRIAFDSDRGGVRGVYVANADGRNVRRVSPEGFAAVPSWSPDGSMLAFARAEADRPQVWNLWTLDLETGELAQITDHHSGQLWGGSWFPGSRRIAYSHD
ncbi:MAG: helix-turn-helix domain-containing protein, partial [Vicinamibacterales bacterium]